MRTFADKVIAFNEQVEFTEALPESISVMNPYKEDAQALALSSAFYRKYYSDTRERHLVLGINPGRFGAGITGVPFTDTKRLSNECGIPYSGKESHEPSSVFVYEMIQAYGGPEEFYGRFYINSMSPLGFTATNAAGKQVNYNYYDSKALTEAVYSFITNNVSKQIALGINTDVGYCLGTGKNEKFLRELNKEKQFFKRIIALEHPRFIVQYKSKMKQEYIDKYLAAFGVVG